MEYEEDLKNTLRKLGMIDMFNQRADLKDISNEALSVSKVKHKAVIEVNERGSEAAGVTSVEISRYSLILSHPMTFDKPFLFIIQDVTNNIPLFFGRVMDPNV